MPGGIAADSQLALEGGLISLGLITVNDARLQVDSPLDQPAAVNYDNLARQVALLNGVLQQGPKRSAIIGRESVLWTGAAGSLARLAP